MPIHSHYLDQAGLQEFHQAGGSRSRVRTTRLDNSRAPTTMLMDLDRVSPPPSHTADAHRLGRSRHPWWLCHVVAARRPASRIRCLRRVTALSPEGNGAWRRTHLQRRRQQEEEAIDDLVPPHAAGEHRLPFEPKGSCDTKQHDGRRHMVSRDQQREKLQPDCSLDRLAL
jgi:hypothetical protein